MAQLNANFPYIECYIRNEFILDTWGVTPGYIFGVKSMINRPLHFHFQSNFGAIFWNMPISAFVHHENYDKLDNDEEVRLSLLQSWDCQSNNIAVTTFAFLQNKMVDVFNHGMDSIRYVALNMLKIKPQNTFNISILSKDGASYRQAGNSAGSGRVSIR